MPVPPDPVTPTDARPLPVSVGLLGRRSVTGALVVLGVALVYMVGAPVLSSVAGDSDFSPGQPFVVGGNVEITPAPGWALDPSSSELFSTLTKNGVGMVVVPASPATQAAEQMAQEAVDGWAADTENTWVVGDPQTFVTNVGDHGVSVTAHSTDEVQESWSIVTDTQQVTILATSPDSVWATTSPEMDAMIDSVQVLENEQ